MFNLPVRRDIRKGDGCLPVQFIQKNIGNNYHDRQPEGFYIFIESFHNVEVINQNIRIGNQKQRFRGESIL